MSESNAIQTSFVRETTEGTTPNSAFLELLLTGGALQAGQSFIRSNQVRTDGQRGASKHVSTDPTGRFDVEWSALAFDELLRGGIRSDSDWSTAVNLSGTDIAAASSGNKFTSSSTNLSTTLTVGQWVRVSGFLTAANNGWFRVVSKSATELVVAGGTLSTEAAGNTITIKGSYIRNGSDKPSYSIQEEFTDLTNRYKIGKGMKIGGWNCNMNPRSIITGNFNFAGMTLAQAASKAGNGSVTAAADNEVMSEVDAVEEVWVDLAAIDWDLTTFRFGVATATRPRSALGSSAKLGIGLGNLNLTGHFETYLDDDSWALETDFLAATKMGIAVAINDGTHYYLVELPRVVLTAEPGNIPGPDADTMYAFDFDAEPGSAEDCTIQICRV